MAKSSSLLVHGLLLIGSLHFLFFPSTAFADQKVWLDFKNESNSTGGDPGDEVGTKGPLVNSPVVASWIRPTDPRLDTPEEVADVITTLVQMQMEEHYKGFWISFSQTDPDPIKKERSIIDFNSGIRIINPFSEEDALGFAEDIDAGNKNKSDDAWIAVDNFTADEDVNTLGKTINELANAGSHEMAHLLGLRHKDGPKNSLVNGQYLGTDLSFGPKAKRKLADSVGLHIGGRHVTTKALYEAISGWVAEFKSLGMRYSPRGGQFGNGAVELTGNLDPHTSTGGTVLPAGDLGFHGEAFGIIDPFGEFVIQWPNALDIVQVLPGGEMELAAFQIQLVDLMQQQPIMQIDVTNGTFRPDAVVQVLEGNDGPDFVPVPEEPLPVPDELLQLAGLRGDANVTILSSGGYLDDITALLSDGLRAEFVILADIDELMGKGETGGTAALRIVPEPSGWLLLLMGLFASKRHVPRCCSPKFRLLDNEDGE